MTPLRIILAGLGARGKYWMEAIRREEGAVAVAYCDPSERARDEAHAAEPNVPVFATLEEAVAAVEVDALVLATPPDTRAPHITLACEKRLPLLVEKPLALDLLEATRYVEESERAAIPLMVGLNFRYLHVTQRVQEMLSSRLVGEAAFARFTYERWRDGELVRLNKYPLTMQQPMLWEQSIHHFDLMRFVYDTEPESVYCRSWNPSWSMYRDDTNISAVFTFENGMTVNYQGTWQGNWVTPGFEWRTECTGGIITQRDQFGSLAYAPRQQETLTEVSLPPHETWLTDTSGVLRAFVRHLQESTPLECSGRDHLQSLRMVAACIESSQRGEAVRFNTFLNTQEVTMV